MVQENIKEIVEQALKKIEHPEIAETLHELRMIKDLRFEDRKVFLNLKLPFKEIPKKEFFLFILSITKMTIL